MGDDTVDSFLFSPSAFSASPREIRFFSSAFIAIGWCDPTRNPEKGILIIAFS